MRRRSIVRPPFKVLQERKVGLQPDAEFQEKDSMNTICMRQGRRGPWLRNIAAGLVAATTGFVGVANGAGVYGTMSNFDVFNDTTDDAYGAEIELEGIHSIDVSATFPAHFSQKSIEEYSVAGQFGGTRVRYSGYNFDPQGYLSPTVGRNTNGHTCVNTPGCEHFGFAVSSQPTNSKFFWLDSAMSRIGNAPAAIPMPTWSYQAGGGIVGARVEPPEVEHEVKKPDSIWMKLYKTEIERTVRLDELMSGNPIVPEDEAETETEWELLEGGKFSDAKDNVKEGSKAVIRRYEFFKYTGAYDDENEPLSQFQGGDGEQPPADELGDFIAANMVAANLEPSALDFFPGDANVDGAVDLRDFAILRDHFGREGSFGDGDFDRNGKVNLLDFGILRSRFNRHQGQAAAPVPEPMTPSILFLAGIAYTALRKRQTK